jgi:hypothetical protein
MSTPVSVLVEYLKDNELLDNSHDDFIKEILSEEKSVMCDFWMEGNRQGWEQQTDWPEDAERYYYSLFGTLEPKP